MKKDLASRSQLMCKKGFPLRVRPGNGRGDSKNRLCRERPGLHPVSGPEHARGQRRALRVVFNYDSLESPEERKQM